MTLTDVMALVVGVAAAYAVVANIPEDPFIRVPWRHLVFVVVRFFQGITLAVSFVALARVGLYRRMPSSAEWLGILVGTTLLTDPPLLHVDSWIYVYRFAFPAEDASLGYVGWRWIMAGVFSLGMLIGFGFLAFGRHLYPKWTKTLILDWVALLAMQGPLYVISQHGADLISPPGGFGAGPAWTLLRGSCGLLAWLPMGLLFGVPTIASLVERLAGQRWTWVEWTAIGSSALTGFASMMFFQGEFVKPGLAFLFERLLVLAWFMTVVVFSRWILIHFGPIWSRWVDDPADQDRSSPSVADSAASTR